MIDILTKLAQGNPGALEVLLKIIEKDPVFINPLGIALDLTNSESYGLWLVYKDMHKGDIDKTMKTLSEWFDNSIKPLEKWLEDRGIQ